MPTLQELKKEVEKLRKENERKSRVIRTKQESGSDLRRIQEERKRLESEIKSLRNPRSAAFKKNLKKGLMKGGRGLMNFLEAAAESQQPRRRPARRSASTVRRQRR